MFFKDSAYDFRFTLARFYASLLVASVFQCSGKRNVQHVTAMINESFRFSLEQVSEALLGKSFLLLVPLELYVQSTKMLSEQPAHDDGQPLQRDTDAKRVFVRGSPPGRPYISTRSMSECKS